MGHPAAFLRLAGCVPPFCDACDTPHALAPGRAMSVEAVVDALGDAPALVVITGGEPFLQWNTGLAALVSRLDASGRTIQYETSGKVGIPFETPGLVVCSPKPMDRPALDDAARKRADVFKFVIAGGAAGEDALTEILALGLPAEKVWLMPEGRDRAQQLRRMPRVWEMCVQTGYRFSPRLHILTFDEKKGV